MAATGESNGIKGVFCFYCGEEDSLAISVKDATVICTNSDCDCEEITVAELNKQALGLMRLAKWCQACPV